MVHLIQVVCCVQLASIALSALPDPVNVIIDSNNFDHILRWEPGAGTPMGMNYRVEWCCRKGNKWSQMRCLNVKDGRECNLTKKFKKIHKVYKARVQAITKTQQSSWTESKWFQPVSQTILGPPEVSVHGCGDCLFLQLSPLKSLLEIYHEFEYFIVMKRAGQSKTSSDMTTILNEYEINNLERATNYCVSVSMSANTNGNSKVSQWHCAFTSPEGKSKVPFLLVAVCVPLVLSAAVMAALVYSGYLCKPKTQLPKVLASFTLHHSSCSLQLEEERCPVGPVFIVYKQERKLKSQSRTLLNSSESEDTDSGGEDGYEAQAMWPPVYLYSSALLEEPKQAYEPDDPAQKQCLLVCDELLVERSQDQPDLEEKEPLIEGRDSEQEESHQDIPLFSVLLESHDDDDDDDEVLESPPVEVALDQDDSKILQEEQQEPPLMGSVESVNCVPDHLNVEMNDNEEQRYYSDEEEEEEEEEDDDCELSGYLRR
ncbi:interferon alpha/beta receptor 2-like [Acipenser ruthenus]|uniref:interferon alpha/beta receptor 2-like n=1 Tax=Acipenser ruthenus TaxID=7906 RepID=UPI00145A2473|nr:interferon alpha/beta receptor 2-like [Acipenser ruthenus]